MMVLRRVCLTASQRADWMDDLKAEQTVFLTVGNWVSTTAVTWVYSLASKRAGPRVDCSAWKTADLRDYMWAAQSAA